MFFRNVGTRRLFDQGRRALDAGDTDRAVDLYERLTALVADNSHAWYNLGLAYKLRRDWPNAVRCNKRAAELDPSNREASWNLGVAATAEREWPTARWAWRTIGLDPGSGDGPPDMRLGPAPIRLSSGEVVWGARLDPCRARIANVPLPESEHRWGDVVLHDVVPNGERQAWGKTWGVFDELVRLEPGEFATVEREVTAPAEEDAEALLSAFGERDLGAEDWTASVRWICRTCSLGSPHRHTKRDAVTPLWLMTRRFAFAGPEAETIGLLDAWAAGREGRSFGPVRSPTPSD